MKNDIKHTSSSTFSADSHSIVEINGHSFADVLETYMFATDPDSFDFCTNLETDVVVVPLLY